MASIQGIYIALFGRPADPQGLEYFNQVTRNGADLSGIGDLTSTKEYQDRFAGKSNADVVKTIYLSLFGREPDAQGLSFFANAMEKGTFSINSIAIAVLDGAQGSDRDIVTNKEVAANLFTRSLDTPQEIAAYVGSAAADKGRSFLTTVTADKATVPSPTSVEKAIGDIISPPAVGGGGGGGSGGGNPSPPPPPQDKTFALTTDIDKFTGGAGNDTFSGVVANSGSTFNAGDELDGGAGTDTLILTSQGNVSGLPTGITVRNIEKLVFSNDQQVMRLDVRTWAGLQEVLYERSNAATTVFSSQGNVSSLTVKGATNLTVGDFAAGTTKKLTDVTVVGATGAVHLGLTGKLPLQTLNITDTSGSVYVYAEPGTRKLDVICKNNNASTTLSRLEDEEATSVTFNIAGNNLTLGYGSFTKATRIDIASDVQFTLANMVAEQCSTMTVTGSGHVNITGRSLAAGHLIDATGSTGGVTVRQHISDSHFKGGDGADLVYFDKELLTKNTLGGGNDIARFDTGILVWRDPDFYALGDNAEVDGGDGIDTLSLDFYDAATASAGDTLGTAFVSKVKGFEILELLTSQQTFYSREINVANLNHNGANAIKEISFAGALTGSGQEVMTLSGLQNDSTLTFKASVDVPRIVVALADTSGNQDILNIKLVGETARTIGSIQADGIETIRIASEDTSTGSSPVSHVLNGLQAEGAKEILLSGAGLRLDNLVTAAEARIDASGVTKTGVSIAMNTDQQGGVTIIGSDWNDYLSGGAGKDVISGGKGNDVFYVRGINQQDVLTGGEGADQFKFDQLKSSSGTSGIVHITDFVAGTDKIFIPNYSSVNLNSALTFASADDIDRIYDLIPSSTTPSNGSTGVMQATVITVTNGAAKGTYLFVNDNDGTTSPANDLLVNITGITGSLSAADIMGFNPV